MSALSFVKKHKFAFLLGGAAIGVALLARKKYAAAPPVTPTGTPNPDAGFPKLQSLPGGFRVDPPPLIEASAEAQVLAVPQCPPGKTFYPEGWFGVSRHPAPWIRDPATGLPIGKCI